MDLHDYVFDLDGDGEDEIISRRINTNTRLTAPPSISAIVIRTHDQEIIEQVNFNGQVMEPRIVDVEKDGVFEIFVPFIRNDSLFVSILNARGRKIWNLFITEGHPRVEPDEIYPWDPSILDFFILGSLPEDSLNLVSIINTGFARTPRGIFIHRLVDGSLLGRSVIGAAIKNHVFCDIDGDETPELVINSWATNNGASSGGFDDSHAYIIAYDLTSKPEIIWSREVGETWSATDISFGDLDQDGHIELFAFMSASGDVGNRSRLELIKPGSWNTYLHRAINQSILRPTFLDLDRDTRPEILTANTSGTLMVLDDSFEIVRQKNLGIRTGKMMALPDLDDDGIYDLAVGSYQNILLLDPSLNIKAIYPRGPQRGSVVGLFKRGNGMPPYLFVKEETRNVALELRPNTYFWVYRYGPFTMWAFIIVSFLASAITISILNRKRHNLQQLHNLLIKRDDRALFIINLNKQILWANDTFITWFLDKNQSGNDFPPINQTFRAYPELLSYLHELNYSSITSPQNHSTNTDIRLGNEMSSLSTSLFLSENGQGVVWVIKISKKAMTISPRQTKVWTLMAERTVHDIKNPLTSILLTIQRLQDTYKQKAPAATKQLDGYSARIVQQVEQLRAKAQNFLKFVDLEEPEFTLTDINSYLFEQRIRLQSYVPEDITLTLKLEENIPSILVDREQLACALENLVSNSINAMLDGGSITISSTLRTMQFSPIEQMRSFLIIEIMDTGEGMPGEMKPHIFEIGTTTSKNGTGLGLMIVKKIIDLHDGYIEFESEEGIGSVCSIYLPLP